MFEPAYLCRGIARRLVAHAEKLAVQAGATGMVILTSPSNDHALGYQDDDLAL